MEVVQHASLRAAIHAIMQEVGYVQRSKSDQLSFNILTEQAVIAATREFFIKHGVLIYPTKTSVHSHAEYVTVKGNRMVNAVVTRTFRFAHLHSDDVLDVEVAGEGMDTSDKAVAKCLTVAKKYAIRELLLLECGNDPDVVVANRDASNGEHFRRACNALQSCQTKEEIADRLSKVLAAKTAEWTEDQASDLQQFAAKRSADLTGGGQKQTSKSVAAL